MGEIKMKIKTIKDFSDNFVCDCGNGSEKNGFQPCNAKGELVDPLPSWDNHYKCMECFQIYKHDV